ncbi:MAG: S8 family serine peptidase, partial [Nanoarchaeota archaeon]|nr:S8 family serine peptidase [Nanoarchaeota archaeon]MBU1850611.1 S8 family serine peptidase [Nanoarchaeota archaeon]
SVFVLLVLFVAGCDFGAICGDGVCDPSEDWLNNCPQDCNLVPVPECHADADCDDNNDYTKDFCDDGYCYHGVLDCLYDSDCDDDNGETRDYCEDNACFHTPISECFDSDDGYNYLVRGTVISNSGNYTDFCLDLYNLTEYACENNDFVSYVNNCGNYQKHCADGACVDSNDVCIESLDSDSSFSLVVNGEELPSKIEGFSGAYTLLSFGKEYLALDNINRNVLVRSENLSSELQLMSNSFSDNGLFIVEMDEEPISTVYKTYEQEIVDLKKNLPLIQADVVAVEQINALKNSYLVRANIQKQQILSKKDSIVNELVKLKAIERTDVKKIYKNSFSGFLVEASKDKISAIENTPGVKKVYPDREVKAFLDVSVPLINADAVWQELDLNGHSLDGTGVTIGIIDTGIDYTHFDLGGCLGDNCKVVGGYDFVNYDSDPMDDQGHGTHCAAIAAGDGVLKGVAPGAKLYAYKVLNSQGSGYTSTIIAAIEKSMDPNSDGDFSDHLDIISLSLGHDGGSPDDDPSAIAIDNAVNAGVVAVVAAGNSGSSMMSVGCPGCARKALTVGASDDYDYLAYFSSRGPTQGYTFKPDIVAPGVNICAAQWEDAFLNYGASQCVDDDHVQISGTSMATPHVAGVVALLLQKNPELTAEEVKATIMQSTESLEYFNLLEVGTGRLDALKAVSDDSVILPSVVELNPADEDWNSFDVEIKNFGSAKGYELSVSKSFRFTSNGLVVQDFSIISDFICVESDSDQTVSLELLGVNDLPLGMYFGELQFVEKESCLPNSQVIAVKNIPFQFKKSKIINITVIGRDFGFEHYYKSTDIYLGSRSSEGFFVGTDDYKIDPDLISHYSLETFVDDNLHVFYFSNVMNILPDRDEAYTYIIHGHWLDEGETDVVIDENSAEKIDTNFGAITSDLGLAKSEMDVNLRIAGLYFYGDPLIIGFGVSDLTKCNNWFRNNSGGFYVSNNGYFDRIFLSEKSKDFAKYSMQSDKWLTLHHIFDYGDGLSYYYDWDDIIETDINWYDSFRFAPGKLISGYANFFSEANSYGMSHSSVDFLNESELSHTVKFYYIPPVNLWFLSFVDYSDYADGLQQSFHYGNSWYIYPVFEGDVNFYEPLIALDFMTYNYGRAVTGYYDGGDDYNFTNPYGDEYGDIHGPYQGFSSYTVELPSGEIKSGSGVPYINCYYPDYSNPVIDGCEQGVYNFKWNASDVVSSGQTYLEKQICWSGYHWFFNLEACE